MGGSCHGRINDALRLPGLLLTLLGLVLSTCLAVAISTGSHVIPGAVYTVAQVQAGLADQPQTWVGRTVWVRGMAEPCPWPGETPHLWKCADDPLRLLYNPADRMAEPLILVPSSADRVAEPLPRSPLGLNALLAVLRGLPLLHDPVVRPQAVPVFMLARFQVQLRRLAAQACRGRPPCYAAMMLDAVP